MPYLVLKKIDGTIIEQWELTDKPVTIGRGEQADIIIKDDRISRQHFTISPSPKGHILKDLGSTNGTWLNNSRVTENDLKPNDRIRLGQTVLTYLTDRPKGLSTIMGEIEAEGKGLKTYISELNVPPAAPPQPPR